MAHLTHVSHSQFLAHWMGCMGWMLTAVALGLIQWRVWKVSDSEVISSGVAWVGIWRTCFYSHTQVTPSFLILHCESISLTEAFTPPEIAAAQVLMLLSVFMGLCGNAAGVYALRNVIFGVTWRIRLVFLTTGALCLSAAGMSFIPLVWNLSSVVTNQTIAFPPDFQMPQAPECQQVGGGIVVGMVGTVLMAVSGIIFCSYRLPVRSQVRKELSLRKELRLGLPVQPVTGIQGKDNPAFESHQHL